MKTTGPSIALASIPMSSRITERPSPYHATGIRTMLEPTMLSLTDSQLEAIMAIAAPIPLERRDAFLRQVAEELAQHAEPGDGLVHRIARRWQRSFLSPPLMRHEPHLEAKLRC